MRPIPVNEFEKAFGIVPEKPTHGIFVRNWLTYKLRKAIEIIEREVYYSNFNVIIKIKKQLQSSIESELDQKAVFIFLMKTEMKFSINFMLFWRKILMKIPMIILKNFDENVDENFDFWSNFFMKMLIKNVGRNF